jgi:hypothetical protein
MIVYGRNQTKYVLGGLSTESAYDGTIYAVEGNADQLVKVFEPNFRTDDNENRILAAIRQRRDIAGEIPIDAAYMQGAFVGFVYERSAAPEPPVGTFDPPPAAPSSTPQPQAVRGDGAGMAIYCVLAGLLMSAAVYFWIFNTLATTVDAVVIQYNMQGLPMIILGWLFMLPTFFRMRRNGSGWAALILGILAFIVGAVTAFCFIWMIVALVRMSASLLQGLLPTILVIAFLIWLYKKLMIHK